MKINISRQYIYLLSLSILLFIFVLIFSFAVLIPEGKEYRINRTAMKKEFKELRKYQNFHNEVEETLKDLQSKNRHIITAFDATFSPQRFEKQHRSYFSSLKISSVDKLKDEDEFMVFEVNTTSQMNSPTSFYDFLDAVNKSDYIIAINFPIEFKRDGELIKSSFTMKVFTNLKGRDTLPPKEETSEEEMPEEE